MKIGALTSNLPDIVKTKEPKNKDAQGFNNVLSGFIGDVNKTQLEAGKITEDFVAGKDVQLHEVMIAGEKAKTSLDLLMEIRNKTIDMYKELIRMQV